MGESESIDEALGRISLENVTHVVLHYWGGHVDSVTIARLNSKSIADPVETKLPQLLFVTCGIAEADSYELAIELNGWFVVAARSFTNAVDVINAGCKFSAIVMNPVAQDLRSWHEKKDVVHGLMIATQIRALAEDAIIFILTDSEDRRLQTWCSQNDSTVYIKRQDTSPSQFQVFLNELPKCTPGMPPRKTRPIRVFLCHASLDKTLVSGLYAQLVESGFKPWLDREDLLPGQDWDSEIRHAVRSSDVVIVCLSTNSISKEGYVQKEIRHALDVADEKPEGAIFIIPVRLEECHVPERLSRWQWVDLFTDNGYKQLVKALLKRADDLGQVSGS